MSKETEILNLLKNNQAFNNPLLDIFNTTNNTIISINTTLIETSVNSICNTIWPLNTPYPSEFTIVDKNNIDTLKTNCVSVIQNMITHTNTLSGSVINGDKNIIALLDLTLTAKDTTDQWDSSKNINTHPLYESASVFFLKKEIITNLSEKTSSLINSYNFLTNTSNTILYLINNYPVFADQKNILREHIDNIITNLNIINTYLTDILNHDNTGWDSIQRKVYNKLFSIKLSSYGNANSEIKEYFKIVGNEKLKNLLDILK